MLTERLLKRNKEGAKVIEIRELPTIEVEQLKYYR